MFLTQKSCEINQNGQLVYHCVDCWSWGSTKTHKHLILLILPGAKNNLRFNIWAYEIDIDDI